MADDESLYLRNTIDGIATEGLYRTINGYQEIARWDLVSEVHATLADHHERTIFVLSVSFDDGRTLLLGEIEPGWPEVVGALHDHLPIKPYEKWEPRILAKPEVYELFIRSKSYG